MYIKVCLTCASRSFPRLLLFLPVLLLFMFSIFPLFPVDHVLINRLNTHLLHGQLLKNDMFRVIRWLCRLLATNFDASSICKLFAPLFIASGFDVSIIGTLLRLVSEGNFPKISRLYSCWAGGIFVVGC